MKGMQRVRWVSLGLLAAALAGGFVGCGSSEGGDGSSDSGGSGGSSADAGSMPQPESTTCGEVTCEGVSFGIPGVAPADACCPEGSDTPSCGLDTAVLDEFGVDFGTTCQPRDLPGDPDPNCPESEPIPIPDTALTVTFPGCCQPSGQCGFIVDTVGGFIELGLGCVDGTPFLEAGVAQPCTPSGGSGGAGGQSGAGGAG